jgi:hypothetical protein
MSKDSWDNYKGLQVPPKHGDLFRAMDQQERFYAEIMKMNEISIQNAFNQLKPKVIAELNAIKNNHLIVFNSKVLNEILSKIQIGNSSDIEFLSKGDIAVDLSSYYLLGNSEIFKSIKLQIPHFFKDYKDIYNGISTPFNKVIDDLLKTTSQVELHSIKNDFLQNLNHLNAYFEYSEGNNYQSPILEIRCKEFLIQVVDDISLKLESFNSNLNLPIIPPLVLNQSQPNQPIGNNQPMTELEKALAEIKALKEVNAAKDLEITRLSQSMVTREEVEQLISENRENIQKMGEELTKIRQDNAEKDGVIEEQIKTIVEQNKDIEHSHQIKEMQTKEIHELRQDKVELREQVKEHKDLAQEWKIIVKEKSESLQKTIEELTIEKAKVSELVQKFGVNNHHDGSSSWSKLEQEEISNAGEGGLENENFD